MGSCTIVDCGRKHKSKGLCDVHYKRVWRGRNVDGPIRENPNGRTSNGEYRIWASMKSRCNPKNTKKFPYHAGKGIEVCDRWKDSFNNFYSDMGPRPSTEHSIDRIDNNKGYELENCRWATRLEQSLNKSVRKDNTTGVVGVYYIPSTKRWNAQIIRHSKTMYHKYFATKEEATAARAKQVLLIDKELS